MDTKFLPKPKNFDGRATEWPDFKFHLSNWMGAMDYRYVEFMEHAAVASPAPGSAEINDGAAGDTPQSELRRRLSVNLCMIVASLVSGKILRSIQRLRSKNGFEAWRQLREEFEPASGNRQLMLLQSLLTPDLSGDLEAFEAKWSTWELEVENYVRTTNKDFTDDLKLAVVSKGAPAEVRAYLHFASDQFDTYKKFKTVLTGYLRSKKVWTSTSMSSQDPVPMEIGAILKGGKKGKGKGKGKGKDSGSFGKGAPYGAPKGGKKGKSKGKGKGGPGKGQSTPQNSENQKFDGYCGKCGKYGHKRADCRSMDVSGLSNSFSQKGSSAQSVHSSNPTSVNNLYEEEPDYYVDEYGDYVPYYEEADYCLALTAEESEVAGEVMAVTADSGDEDLMVDSGSTVHMSPPNFAAHFPLDSTVRQKSLFGVNGSRLQHQGIQEGRE